MWSEAPVARQPLAPGGARRPGAAARRGGRRWSGAAGATPPTWRDRFLPVARLCLLGFYVFASFAKLNSALLRPLGELRHLLLPRVHRLARAVGAAARRGRRRRVGGDRGDGGDRAVDPVAAASSAAPGNLGVVVGLAFHAVLALDRTHQFFDFSSVLVRAVRAVPAADGGVWVARAGRLGAGPARCSADERAPRVGAPGRSSRCPCSRAARWPSTPSSRRAGARRRVGALAAVRGAAVLATSCASSASARRRRPARALRVGHVAFLLVPLLVFANGLTPYLELKTGLRLEHVLQPPHRRRRVEPLRRARARCPLTDVQADLVRIVSHRRPRPWRRTWPGTTRSPGSSSASTCPTTPTCDVVYDRGNARPVDPGPGVRRPGARASRCPRGRRSCSSFRPVDLQDPERCVPTFGARTLTGPVRGRR